MFKLEERLSLDVVTRDPGDLVRTTCGIFVELLGEVHKMPWSL